MLVRLPSNREDLADLKDVPDRLHAPQKHETAKLFTRDKPLSVLGDNASNSRDSILEIESSNSSMESSFIDSEAMEAVAPVFEKQYSAEYLKQIKSKQVIKTANEPDYNDFEKSCKLLETGITAIKFNYSN